MEEIRQDSPEFTKKFFRFVLVIGSFGYVNRIDIIKELYTKTNIKNYFSKMCLKLIIFLPDLGLCFSSVYFFTQLCDGTNKSCAWW